MLSDRKLKKAVNIGLVTIAIATSTPPLTTPSQAAPYVMNITSLQSTAELALAGELASAANNLSEMNRILVRELAARNQAGLMEAVLTAVANVAGEDGYKAVLLAESVASFMSASNPSQAAILLADAAVIVAATDTAIAATLIISAVALANRVETEVQEAIGFAASAVASTAASNGDDYSASLVTSAVAESNSSGIATSFNNAGAAVGTSVPSVTVSAELETVTPSAGTAAPPPQPSADNIPIIVEPSPSQSGSPT